MAMAVKNRAPAGVQVTAEQLVRAARERQVGDEERAAALRTAARVTDEEELRMQQAQRRREFEGSVTHAAMDGRMFVKYARYEESQLEFRRARSVFERAIERHNREPSVWLEYAEFEMRNKFVNHARNVLDRAVQHLPRAAALWFRYVQLEETLGQVDKARAVFERWMAWHPDEQAWRSFINFETRHGEPARARDALERFCGSFPRAASYIKFARWEEASGQLALARRVFERALVELDRAEALRQDLFVAFARFEERCKEFERARAIYKQALGLLPEDGSRELYEAYVSFERQHGDRDSIESVLADKRRAQYEEQLRKAPDNYDLWFDLTRLEEAHAQAEAAAAQRYVDALADSEQAHLRDARAAELFQDRAYAVKVVDEARARVRSAYERAVANLPPSSRDKAMWKRYIYLWINYALFEELQVEDVPACRAVYRRCLDTIPHKHFTFAKVWVMAAHFEVRQRDLARARRIFGEAIGRCPRSRTFRAYIQLELQLGNVNNCRALYGKYLEFDPTDCLVWQKYAELEHAVGETARCRAIFELAVQQPELDMPETLWKRYIDFEIGLGSKTGRANARKLYERLLERTQHVKVWISYAKFEALVADDAATGRALFEKAYQRIKKSQAGDQDLETKEDRALLLQAWLDTERKIPGADKEVQSLESRQPKRVKRKRQLEGGGWEEYNDFLFPDDPKKGLKLLQIAQQWKKRTAPSSGEGDAVPAAAADAGPGPAKVPRVATDENEIDLDDL